MPADMTPQQVLITRPEPGASELARALGGGIVSPVMRVAPRELALPEGLAGLVLTSANGVRALGGRGPRLAWCVGDRTAAEAEAAGYEAHSAGGDSDALVALIAAHGAGPLLHVRGAHARGDVAARLTAAGVPCAEAVAYDQPFVPLTAEAEAALAGTAPLLVPLYSPRAAARLAVLARNAAAPLHVVAMSPAVARAARPLGPARVAERPDADAMLLTVRECLANDPPGLDRP